MKKVSLCLHGYFNNRADPNSGMNGYDYIKENIIERKDCEVDVFFHSWEPDRELTLKDLYVPVKYKIEAQANFDQLSEQEKYINEGFNRAVSKFSACRIPSTLSFLYSRAQSLKLKSEHEESEGFKYDCVVTARFDLGQRDKHGKWKYYVSQIDFDPNRDMSFVYSAMWDQLNAGYADQWFYSNSENMDILATAYEKCFEYFQPQSDFEKALTTGWKDSKMMDNMSSSDPGQFTNEMLKEVADKSSDLMKYPRWQMINNHILYKWFMIDTGLYKKSRFI